MRGEDFTTALQTLGLDTHAAAKWLGVSVRAVQRYRVSGAPGPVAGMVRLALEMDRRRDRINKLNDRIAHMHGHLIDIRNSGDLWSSSRASLALDWRE